MQPKLLRYHRIRRAMGLWVADVQVEGPASVSSIAQFGLGGCELDDDVQFAIEDVECAVRICIH